MVGLTPLSAARNVGSGIRGQIGGYAVGGLGTPVLIALIEEAAVISRILWQLGLPTDLSGAFVGCLTGPRPVPYSAGLGTPAVSAHRTLRGLRSENLPLADNVERLEGCRPRRTVHDRHLSLVSV